MTDKQIIIDGVDVSGCPHIEYEHKWWNMAGHEQNSENVCALSFDKNADFEEDFLCQDNPNCDYKQLKRSEAQCEAMFVSHTDLEKKYKAKEQECEAYKMEADEGKEINAELKSENKHLNDLLNQALKELEKTRKTLTEIKEIAEEWEGAESAYMVSSLILQKISECEGNDVRS